MGFIRVEKMGVEPTTSWLPVKRSSQLSYIPEDRKYSTSSEFQTFYKPPMCIKRETIKLNYRISKDKQSSFKWFVNQLMSWFSIKVERNDISYYQQTDLQEPKPFYLKKSPGKSYLDCLFVLVFVYYNYRLRNTPKSIYKTMYLGMTDYCNLIKLDYLKSL